MRRLAAEARRTRFDMPLRDEEKKNNIQSMNSLSAVKLEILRDKTMPRRTELRSKIREPFDSSMLEARITLALTQRQVEALTRLAQAENRSINYVIRTAIDAMVEANQLDSDKP